MPLPQQIPVRYSEEDAGYVSMRPVVKQTASTNSPTWSSASPEKMRRASNRFFALEPLSTTAIVIGGNPCRPTYPKLNFCSRTFLTTIPRALSNQQKSPRSSLKAAAGPNAASWKFLVRKLPAKDFSENHLHGTSSPNSRPTPRRATKNTPTSAVPTCFESLCPTTVPNNFSPPCSMPPRDQSATAGSLSVLPRPSPSSVLVDPAASRRVA